LTFSSFGMLVPAVVLALFLLTLTRLRTTFLTSRLGFPPVTGGLPSLGDLDLPTPTGLASLGRELLANFEIFVSRTLAGLGNSKPVGVYLGNSRRGRPVVALSLAREGVHLLLWMGGRRACLSASSLSRSCLLSVRGLRENDWVSAAPRPSRCTSAEPDLLGLSERPRLAGIASRTLAVIVLLGCILPILKARLSLLVLSTAQGAFPRSLRHSLALARLTTLDALPPKCLPPRRECLRTP